LSALILLAVLKEWRNAALPPIVEREHESRKKWRGKGGKGGCTALTAVCIKEMRTNMAKSTRTYPTNFLRRKGREWEKRGARPSATEFASLGALRERKHTASRRRGKKKKGEARPSCSVIRGQGEELFHPRFFACCRKGKRGKTSACSLRCRRRRFGRKKGGEERTPASAPTIAVGGKKGRKGKGQTGKSTSSRRAEGAGAKVSEKRMEGK